MTPAEGDKGARARRTQNKKKRLRIVRNRFRNLKPRMCRYAGIPNQTVQGGHSWFNFGFVELATLTPIERLPRPVHINGSRNIWQSRTPQGRLKLTLMLTQVKANLSLKQIFLRRQRAVEHRMHRTDLLLDFKNCQIRQWPLR